MRVLGLACTGDGSALCLVEDGRVVGATTLERLTRAKGARSTLPEYRDRLARIGQAAFELDEPPEFADFYEVFPLMLHAVTGESELRRAGIDLVVKTPDDIRPMRGGAEPYERFLAFLGEIPTRLDLEHHRCRTHQAFDASPFDTAAVATLDGMGGTLTKAVSTTLAEAGPGGISVLAEVERPSSVGALFRNITRYLGFGIDDENRTMALAAFGSDRFYRQVRDRTLSLFDDGTFELRDDYLQPLWQFCPRRDPDGPLGQEHFDVAWACQGLAEDVLLHVARSLHRRTGHTRLALAGRTAQNPAANARILRDSGIDSLFVVPNADDTGLSLGAAMYGYHVVLGGSERHPPPDDFFGPPLADADVTQALRDEPGTTSRRSDDVAADVAELLARGRIVGWVQGRSEFGPRALGHRSIVADPRAPATKERLDRDVTGRDRFGSYAPSVLAEQADVYFDLPAPSLAKLVAATARPIARERTPAIVHADGSARVQTVAREVDPLFHRLISRFHELAGVPLVLNAGLQGAGEPLVESPRDAVRALHSLGLDAVAVGDHLAWRDGAAP
jgi:carbamoyltransferase